MTPGEQSPKKSGYTVNRGFLVVGLCILTGGIIGMFNSEGMSLSHPGHGKRESPAAFEHLSADEVHGYGFVAIAIGALLVRFAVAKKLD